MKHILLATLFLSIILLGACGDKENPTPTLPKLSIGDFTFLEGNATTTFEFQLTLTAAYTEDIFVSYRTQSISAVEGEDYEGIPSAVLTIPSGQTIANIEVRIITDEWLEGDEQFQVILFDAVNAVLDDEVGLGTIRNDDTQLAIDDTGYTTPTSYAGYDMVWNDEFDGNTLNLDDWTYELGDGCPSLCGWGNNEEQYYTSQSDNIYFLDGKLIIEAKQETFGGKSYTSTRIKTEGKQFFKFGRIDIRAKLPEGRGIWPALWMLPNEWVYGGWPTSGEIDIMEMVGHQASTVHGTAHWGPATGNSINSGNARSLSGGAKYIDEFHVFSIEWEENSIKWYVDDVLYHELTNASVGSNIYPFNENFFFLFNVAVGGNWPGSPDSSTTFPQRMIVDYIRVFQRP